MKKTRTLISSSIVSFIIMILGMFMLCMSRAPQISFDEPLIEGGGVRYDSVDVDDQDFLKLLDDSSENTISTGNSNESTSNDDNFLSQLNEGDQSTTSYNPSSDSSDEGMDEILRLLELDDQSTSDNKSTTDQSDWNQELTSTELSESATQSGGSNSSDTVSIDNLNKEIEQLENVLANKSSQVENLQTEINQYDQKINEFERSRSAPGGGNQTPVRTVSYEATTSEKSGYNMNYNTRDEASISADFDDSYNTALDLFRNHQYPQATDMFFQLLQKDPRHPLADNCQYWIGECRYAQGKFYQAVVDFNKVFAFDVPDKQDDAQLMIGLSYLKLGELISARTEFDWLVSCFASSEYINTAHRYLGQF